MGFVELVVGGPLAERLMHRSYGEKGVKDRVGRGGLAYLLLIGAASKPIQMRFELEKDLVQAQWNKFCH